MQATLAPRTVFVARPAARPAARRMSRGAVVTAHDPVVFFASFLGWFVPSNIPVPAFGGQSLFSLLHESMLAELSHFPTGPALTDPFWLYLFLWHFGLFLTMNWGQIGVQARKQGYW
eukprot:scaffold16.g121.t1